MIVASTLLWFCHGSSDKVYKAEVIQNTATGTCTLTAYWGRRGKTMQSQTKGVYTSQWQAMVAFRSLVASKTSKGYEVVDSVPA